MLALLLNFLRPRTAAALLCLAAAGTANGTTPPSVVLIISDDAGYADLLHDRENGLETPNIDSIGAAGVRFTSGYVTASVCSPSRAGMLTGRYQQRVGHEFNLGGPDEQAGLGLPTSARTIAERLKPMGYASALIGKWHLGTAEGLHPLDQGFDTFEGMLAGSRTFFATDSDQPKTRLMIFFKER
ncbi:MAG: sulfatase-like hydrolase/transferase [Planctomycetota bacterium]